MKLFFIVAILFSFISFSCGSSSGSSQNTYQDPHDELHQEMHNDLYQEELLKVLDGKWSIKEVYGMAIDSTQFDGKQPAMIFEVTKEAFYGNDGCNSFNGKVDIKKDKIIFGPAATTLMACPHMEMSGKIRNSFSSKELTYTLNDDLILYESDQQVMLLKRAE